MSKIIQYQRTLLKNDKSEAGEAKQGLKHIADNLNLIPTTIMAYEMISGAELGASLEHAG